MQQQIVGSGAAINFFLHFGPEAATSIDAIGQLTPEPGERVVDATDCVVYPAWVNTHHHLYQWATQGLHQDATLFEWLTGLYDTWAGIDAEIVHDAATAGLGSGVCSGAGNANALTSLFPI